MEREIEAAPFLIKAGGDLCVCSTFTTMPLLQRDRDGSFLAEPSVTRAIKWVSVRS